MRHIRGQRLSENCSARSKLGPYIESGRVAGHSNTNLQLAMSVVEAD